MSSKATHRTRSSDVEAWFYSGQPYADMERETGRYALCDEDGSFYRWMDAAEFNRQYERIIP